MRSHRVRRGAWPAVLLCGTLLFGPGPAWSAAADAPAQQLSTSLQAHLAADKLQFGSQWLVTAPLRALYAGRSFAPQWLDRDGGEQRARQLLAALKGAAAEGLEAGDYATDEIERRLGNTANDDLAALAALDLLLTEQFLRYARDLRDGRDLAPRAEYLFPKQGPAMDAEAMLSGARAASDLPGFLRGLAPDSARYRDLRRSLAEYRAIAARGGWPVLPEGLSLQQEMSDPRVAVLRVRLAASDDLDAVMGAAVAGGSQHFDPVLTEVVVRFQERHGLEADGVVGRKTRAALNVPVAQRVAQIIVNMERRRRIPDHRGDRRYILVSIAAYSLALIEDEKVLLDMRVIVGRPKRQTPVFSGLMTYLDLNPTWTVPKRIARLDILPQVRKDLAYLSQQNIRVFTSSGPSATEIDPSLIDWLGVVPGKLPVTLRQDPGPGNALGQVKFMLPNDYAVYLHDTPARNLFGPDRRAFSSGCIRLERPLELAEYLLADKPGWSRARIDREIEEGGTRTVTIPRPVPVHMTYVTAWVGSDGRAHFRDDIYGRDGELGQAILTATRGGDKLVQLQ